MSAKKGIDTKSDGAWLNDALGVLNIDSRVWRDQKEAELYQAENERHQKLAIVYQSKLDKAFRSKKSKQLMIANLPFVTEVYEGEQYVKFEGTVFTAEEFKERINYLFREHVEKLWEAQLKIEAADEAQQLEIISSRENTIAISTTRQSDADGRKERGRKDKAKANNKNLKARKVKK
jgi:hypothetical protein